MALTKAHKFGVRQGKIMEIYRPSGRERAPCPHTLGYGITAYDTRTMMPHVRVKKMADGPTIVYSNKSSSFSCNADMQTIILRSIYDVGNVTPVYLYTYTSNIPRVPSRASYVSGARYVCKQYYHRVRTRCEVDNMIITSRHTYLSFTCFSSM